MACNLTTGFNIDCRDGVGGVKAIYIAQLADKATYAETAGVVTSLTLATGKQFFKYEQVTGVANLSSKGTGNVNTLFYETTAAYQINGLTAAKISEIELIGKKPLMIIVLDENDDYFVAGTDSGLWANDFTIQTGTAKGDLSGTTINLTGQENRPLKPLDPTLIATLIVPAV